MPELRTALERNTWAMIQGMGRIHWTKLAQKGVAPSTARKLLHRWCKDGALIQQPRDDQGRIFFALSDAEPTTPQPPAFDNSQEAHLWRGMRGLRSFSVTDLVAHSGVAVTATKAREYCRFLLLSGHIVTFKSGVPQKREAIYKLVRNTGPQAPRPMRIRGVLDPNTQVFCPEDQGITV